MDTNRLVEYLVSGQVPDDFPVDIMDDATSRMRQRRYLLHNTNQPLIIDDLINGDIKSLLYMCKNGIIDVQQFSALTTENKLAYLNLTDEADVISSYIFSLLKDDEIVSGNVTIVTLSVMHSRKELFDRLSENINLSDLLLGFFEAINNDSTNLEWIIKIKGRYAKLYSDDSYVNVSLLTHCAETIARYPKTEKLIPRMLQVIGVTFPDNSNEFAAALILVVQQTGTELYIKAIVRIIEVAGGDYSFFMTVAKRLSDPILNSILQHNDV